MFRAGITLLRRVKRPGPPGSTAANLSPEDLNNQKLNKMLEDLRNQKNVLGNPLEICSTDPMTGYIRDGKCTCITQDPGQHTIAAVLTSEFLEFSKSIGNDLSTPRPEFGFDGLKEGDHWCLCLMRWIEAVEHEKAPRVKLEATNESVLRHVKLEILKKYQHFEDK